MDNQWITNGSPMDHQWITKVKNGDLMDDSMNDLMDDVMDDLVDDEWMIWH